MYVLRGGCVDCVVCVCFFVSCYVSVLCVCVICLCYVSLLCGYDLMVCILKSVLWVSELCSLLCVVYCSVFYV